MFDKHGISSLLTSNCSDLFVLLYTIASIVRFMASGCDLRFCNLACGHCYSASGPTVRDALPAAQILDALGALRAEGYEVLSLSGGEPLLYREFEALVRGATALGFCVNLITNRLRAIHYNDSRRRRPALG